MVKPGFLPMFFSSLKAMTHDRYHTHLLVDQADEGENIDAIISSVVRES